MVRSSASPATDEPAGGGVTRAQTEPMAGPVDAGFGTFAARRLPGDPRRPWGAHSMASTRWGTA